MKITLSPNIQPFIALEVDEATIPDEIIVETKPQIKTEHLILTVQSPMGKKQYNADKKADITELCKMEGTVYMKLSQTVGGELLNEWQIEPLKLRIINDSIIPLSTLTDIDNRLSALEIDGSKTKQAISEIVKLIKE